MFDFRKIKLEDRDWINACLKVSDFRGCEYSFANNMAWQRLNDTQICRYGDFYISCSYENKRPYITFPSGVKTDDKGREEYIKLFYSLRKYFSDLGKPLTVSSVTEDNLKWLREYYGGDIEYRYDRDGSDYVYNVSDLTELSGKKYHGKRNHIKRFCENDWNFELISDDNVDRCFEFCVNIYNKDDSYSEFSKVVEQYAIDLFLTDRQELKLKGGVLKSNGEIVGISIGEQLNSDTFVVHIEKARGDIQGAYPTLCNEFVKAFAQDFKYINREEDLGIDGLRKSKLSYHPAFMVDKYVLTFK